MNRFFFTFAFLALMGLVACSSISNSTAQFWRPISEPNIQMSLDKVQTKLDFDVSQCKCGIYPANVTHDELTEFQPDKQRLSETSAATSTPNDDGNCVQQPSMVVAECMRTRGWEVTKCSGRMPLADGGALCAATVYKTP